MEKIIRTITRPQTTMKLQDKQPNMKHPTMQSRQKRVPVARYQAKTVNSTLPVALLKPYGYQMVKRFSVLKKMEIKDVNNCGVDWECHVVTETEKLLYLKGNKIRQYNTATKNKTLFIRLKSTPNCISIFLRSGNIIVGIIKNNSENERGIVLSLNENGDSVWKQNMSHVSRYIANDAEGNIYISLSGNFNCSVLALGIDGHYPFAYKGYIEKHGFMPQRICADKPGLVFVINASQRNIHVIDKKRTFSLRLRTDGSFLHLRILINNEGYIQTCSGNDIFQWRVSEDVLQLNFFEDFNQRDVSNKLKVTDIINKQEQIFITCILIQRNQCTSNICTVLVT